MERWRLIDAIAEERITVPPEVPGGVAWARVADPSLALDDTRYFHLPRVGASRVLVVDGDPGATAVASEVYFLERALAPWGGGRGGVLPEIKALSGLAELDPERHRVVILANVAGLVANARELQEALGRADIAAVGKCLKLIEIAQRHGVPAKFPGSGGAVVGLVVSDERAMRDMTHELERNGCVVVRLKAAPPID